MSSSHNWIQARTEFGHELRRRRTRAQLSQRRVGQLALIPHSLVSSIESGDRAVGSDIAVKLADALALSGKDRDGFLLKAAGTRKKDRLIGCARTLAAEIVNYLPLMLRDAGLPLERIKSVKMHRGVADASSCEGIPASQDEPEMSRTLELELQGGKKWRCSLMMEPVV